jgi:hypothetical protein
MGPALAIHPTTGDVYVAGVTNSKDFPKTTGGAQNKQSGGGDAFVARLNSDLTQILQSTYLGGREWDLPTPLPFIPQLVRSMWREGQFPKTFLTLLAGRRRNATSVLVASLKLRRLCGKVEQSLPKFSSPPTWEEAIRIMPTPLPFIPQRARSMWRDIPFPPTFLKLLVGRRPSATSVMPESGSVTPLWQG